MELAALVVTIVVGRAGGGWRWKLAGIASEPFVYARDFRQRNVSKMCDCSVISVDVCWTCWMAASQFHLAMGRSDFGRLSKGVIERRVGNACVCRTNICELLVWTPGIGESVDGTADHML